MLSPTCSITNIWTYILESNFVKRLYKSKNIFSVILLSKDLSLGSPSLFSGMDFHSGKFFF